jgi:hypothetical protein
VIFYLSKASQDPDIVILSVQVGRFREAFWRLFLAFAALSAIPLMTVTICLLTVSAGDAYTIEGKIEHVEHMPAVEQKFTPGIQFDQTVELSPNNLWVKIPKWISGSWSAREEMAVFSQDFRTGRSHSQQETFKAKQDFTYGQQIDKSGQVWHYLGVPYTSKTVHTSSEEIHEVKEKQFLKATDDEVAFRAVATVLFVDNLSNRIQRTYQQESLTTYQPISDDRMSMAASTKVFDASGRPQTLQKNEAIIKRYKHFHPISEQDGKDLKALFRNFLTAKGMADLLPD